MAATKNITLLKDHSGKTKSNPKHFQKPETKVSIICVVPDDFPSNGVKMLKDEVVPFVNEELKGIHGALSDLDKIIDKTVKQINALSKKKDAASAKKLKALQKEGQAQLKAAKRIDDLVKLKRKDIQTKAAGLVERRFEAWKKEDKQRRNHKIKIAAKISLSSVVVAATTGVALAATGAGVGASVVSLGAGVPLAVAAAGAGASAIATSLGALVKIALNAKNSLKSEKQQRQRLKVSLDNLMREIAHQEQDALKNYKDLKKRGRLSSMKHKLTTKKDRIMSAVRALKGEGTKIKGIMKDHKVALTKIRQDALNIGKKLDRVTIELADATKKLSAAQKAKDASPEAQKAVAELDKYISYLNGKIVYVNKLMQDKEQRLTLGKTLHTAVEKFLAEWQKGNTDSFKKLGPLFAKAEAYAPQAIQGMKVLVDMGSKTASIVKCAAKIAA